MKIRILFLFLFISSGIFCSPVKKAYKKYKEKEYDEALSLLTNEITSGTNCPEVSYLYAMILSEPNYEKHNYDSAYSVAKTGADCYDLLDGDAKDKLYKKYALSFAGYNVLLYNISVDAFKELDKSSIDDLKHFIDFYAKEKTVRKAQQLYDEIVIFSKIPKDKDVGFYADLIKKYPDNKKINEVWKLFYDTYTFDGEAITFQKFILKYYDFPFDSIVKKDIFFAKEADYYELETRNDRPPELYDKFIKHSAPRIKAFKVLRNYITPYLKAHDWNSAIKIAEKYKLLFLNSHEYQSFMKTLLQKDEPTVIRPFSKNVNTEDWEYSPLISADGQHLYFCGKRRDDNIGGEDIFLSDSTPNGWGKPRLIKEISTSHYNEAPEAISVDETIMLLFKEGDIYFSKQEEQGWSEMRKFPHINTYGWEGDAVLSADGRAVLFASESGNRKNMQFNYPNRSDRYDIFVSELTKEGWSAPINLGDKINTTFTDRYPYLHNDMKTLYFSSMGHGALGGTDVFMSKRLYDTSWVHWSDPVNLGKYINTTGYDNGYKITATGDVAYYANYDGKQFDMFYVNLPKSFQPEAVVIVEGVITDENQKPISAEIIVENLSTGEIIGKFRNVPSTGKYVFTLPLGGMIGFYIDKKFYYPHSSNVDLSQVKNKQRVVHNVILQSIKNLLETQASVELENVFFDTDKYDILKESFPELNRVVGILTGYEKLYISIHGHTDNTGSDSYNLALSEKRANSIKQYFILNGINEKRISIKGFGATVPIASNATEEGKQENRRVEIQFGTK